MKPSYIALALLLSAPTILLADTPAPAPGLYIGVLRVTKVHAQDSLATSYTLKAQARVFPDGTISFATTAPESPAAASNVESTLDRAAPIVPPAFPVDDPLIVLTNTDPVTVAATTANYIVDANHRAKLTLDGNILKLVYANPVAGYRIIQAFVPHPGIPGSGGTTIGLAPNSQFTVFQYTLRKRR